MTGPEASFSSIITSVPVLGPAGIRQSRTDSVICIIFRHNFALIPLLLQYPYMN